MSKISRSIFICLISRVFPGAEWACGANNRDKTLRKLLTEVHWCYMGTEVNSPMVTTPKALGNVADTVEMLNLSLYAVRDVS